jgi:hypothetical protein
LPALIKATFRNERGLFLLQMELHHLKLSCC